ncbi:MAG: glycoside hydrolase family 113 [Solirubrobacteraceae bacterium]
MLRRLIPLLVLLALAAPTAQARTIKPLPESWQKGMNVAAFRWDQFGGDRFYYWMRQLHGRAHADHAMFAMRWIQYWKDPLRGDDLASTDINPAYGSPKDCKGRPRTDYTKCQTPSLAATRKAMLYAKKLGMKIEIKPLVDVGRNPQAQAGREYINFADPDDRAAWFASYRVMLGRYAALARDVGADMLVVGTGLTKMTDSPAEQEEWRAMIADIRTGDLMADGKGGFAGKLTYATRWDAIYKDAYDPEQPLFFWDDLDYIGVEGFWPLINGNDPDHDNPSISRLRQGWTFNFLQGGMPPGAALRALHDEYLKPVLLTGLGYVSRGGTSAGPFKGDYEQAGAGGKINMQAQERPIHASFDFWSGVARQGGWFRGIYWWNWLPKIGYVKTNGDYTAQGKPAEVELCLRHLGHASRACKPSGMPK